MSNSNHNQFRESHRRKIERRHQFYRSFEAQALKERSFFEKMSDELTVAFGSTGFLIVNIIWFTTWIIINIGAVPGIESFDPFPFGLLTMVVSLEAIFLAIIILVSQNRSSYIATIREELHMQINLIAEEEITKSLKLLAEIRDKIGINEKDLELDEMLHRINTGYIEKSLVEQIQKANINLGSRLVNKLKDEFQDVLDPLKIMQQGK